MNGGQRPVKHHHLVAAATTFAATLAHAHDGHGLAGAHWHASDAWGFVVIALLVGGVLWMRGK